MRDLFVIDLEDKIPSIQLYSVDDIEKDLKFFQCDKVSDLIDNDWKVFKTEKQAEKFLSLYETTLKSLDNAKIKKGKFPCILLKRRYIVTSLMKLKTSTYRNYLKKDWKVGDLINFNDQTFFLTVKLTNIEQVDENLWRYDYKLV